MAKPAEFTYYYEVHQDSRNVKKGVYMYTATRQSGIHYSTLTSVSDKIWRQGPKGGVRVIKDRYKDCNSYYITKNKEKMKQFMWVKLQAKTFIN